MLLDPQLAKDTVIVGRFPLSLVLLSRDANYPWCILVPQREDIREIHQLTQADQQQLLIESSTLSMAMEGLFQPFKMNVAALGNMVPQLHVHHIARFQADPAWPKPVWGAVEPLDYHEPQLSERVSLLRGKLAKSGLTVDDHMI